MNVLHSILLLYETRKAKVDSYYSLE
jgi:hypothetical protein